MLSWAPYIKTPKCYICFKNPWELGHLRFNPGDRHNVACHLKHQLLRQTCSGPETIFVHVSCLISWKQGWLHLNTGKVCCLYPCPHEKSLLHWSKGKIWWAQTCLGKKKDKLSNCQILSFTEDECSRFLYNSHFFVVPRISLPPSLCVLIYASGCMTFTRVAHGGWNVQHFICSSSHNLHGTCY